MNKKFSTFLVGALLAMSVNGWAQIVPPTTTNPDKTNWAVGSPNVSPLPVTTANGAKPISRVEGVNTKADSRYYQFVVDGATDQVLTMVYNTTTKRYEVAVESVSTIYSAPATDGVKLDRTLWEVRASRYSNSNEIYYVLVNKASQLPLNLQAGSLDIQSGASYDWRWADGDYSGNAATPLSGTIRAAVNATTSIYLVEDAGNLEVVSANTNTPPNNAITFQSWEANPIVLTAEEINTELGYEAIRDEKGTRDSFKFTFDPTVEGTGAVNPMLGVEFTAVAPKTNFGDKVPGDTPNGFVRFQQKGTDKYLIVDTAYHDAANNAKYDLKMAVKAVEYPRSVALSDGVVLRNNRIYVSETATTPIDYDVLYESNVLLAQLKRQSNFKPIYYPATQNVKLQAEMVFKADKAALNAGNSWSSLMRNQGLTGADLNIAAATDYNTVNAYYRAYTQNQTSTPVSADIVALEYAPVAATAVPATPAWNMVGLTNSAIDLVNTNQFATAHTTLVKLVTLTASPKHTELTCDTYDTFDTVYDGILTHISFADLKSIYTQFATIANGYYYIQNANKVSTDLLRSGDYRYEDLAATTATYAYFNANTKAWEVGYANTANPGEYAGKNAAKGNIVYSADMKEIPSAQFYVSGNGGYYTMTNRESGRVWNTSYWWVCEGEENTYVNHATYTDGTGQKHTFRDTIKIIPVSASILADPYLGYLNISQDEAKADTSVFNFKFNTVGVDLYMGVTADSLLKVMEEAPGKFKLERVLVEDTDKVTILPQYEDDLVYGIKKGNEAQLKRAMYYLYVDEVSSNSGQETGVRYRQYVTLEGGVYRIAKVKVEVDGNGYTTNAEQDVIAGTRVDPRKAFYVKGISSEDKELHVLIDPETVGREVNENGDSAHGVRLFVNQLTAEVQPAGLISQAASNVYDNSVFTFEKVTKYNYRDVRTEGAVRDTLRFVFAENDNFALYASGDLKGQGKVAVDLLGWINDKEKSKNYAMFVDTANVSKVEFPRFLLGVNQVDTYEYVEITDDNKDTPIYERGRHRYTTADYLVNLIDSAKTNSNYKYSNSNVNIERNYYRLGFVNARHEGDKLYIGAKKDAANTIDLSGEGLTYATMAFRYISTDRDLFFIETAYDGNTPGWIKVINEVAVVVPDIQEATPFQVEETDDTPTSNAVVEGSAVQVIAGNGAVTVKNAAGKKVVISNILGQTVANSTVSSDNATIAVPAGVVVVAVEGETAVKAVVR